MQVRLEVSHNKANIKRVLIQNDAILGRSKECNLRIASGQVSRQHCKVLITDSEVYVKDLGSSNGTFVDGKRVPSGEKVAVDPGTELAIGPARFVFRFERPEQEPAANPIDDAITDISITDPENAPGEAPNPVEEEVLIGLSDDDASAVIEEAAPEPVDAADAEPVADDVPDFGFIEADDPEEVTAEPESEVAVEPEPIRGA